ncbi:MAG TPA: hypothetical protein VE954_30040 [Oligoflexus sp.]|uniref:hypothetical protein n=1 Tax=Oligoflexus sp. TaxID=1971216 RepID=UPI002D3AC582|nr:hypothetical protein [Oligoflexus sp.]HYX37365.1 hypothetical protein [Oligoflexus sp.]
MKNGLLSLAAIMFINACGQPSRDSLTQEAWNQRNDPRIMGLDRLTQKYQYETQFDKLPVAADLPQTPWSDYYWPTYQGGLTYRWAQAGSDYDRYVYATKPFAELKPEEIAVLSPAEKYDLYMGFEDYRTTKAERERTGVLKRIPGQDGYDARLAAIPTWEGLCHAWAPATLAFAEPQAVTVKNKAGLDIPFGSSDINGLLTMFLHHVPAPQVSFLGGRCEENLSAIQDKIEEVRNAYAGSPYSKLTAAEKEAEIKRLQAELTARSEQIECRDSNAGAFHLVLTNQIGLMKEGFVVDVTRDDEVWNQAVHGFNVRVESVKQGRSRDAAPRTVKEITVTTTMKYIVEVGYHQDRGGYDSSAAQATVDYRYRVELDRNGAIIGGQWLSFERPDFLWKQTTPKFEGDFNGVGDIYKAATTPAL